MKCKQQRKPRKKTPVELTEKEVREWETTSAKLAVALAMLAEYPLPYPTACLPALIF